MDKPILLDLAQGPVPVTIRRSGLAKRMSLRVAPDGGVVVVLPTHAPASDAGRFARAHLGWIEARLAKAPPQTPLVDGVEIPFMGIPHVIRHEPKARRGVWAEAGVIGVSGLAETVPRRVEAFLRDEARMVLAQRARDLAEKAGLAPGRVTARDTVSRWGSCASNGNLSFSWRLILAPAWVLDYVVAHEVAHLAEMNHGPRFWRLVDQLSPDAKTAKAWLKRHGPELHRIGGSAQPPHA